MPRLTSRPVQPTGPTPTNNHGGGARKHGVSTKDEPRTSPPQRHMKTPSSSSLHRDVEDLYGKNDDDELMGATSPPKVAPGLMPNTNGGDLDRKSARSTTVSIVAASTSSQREQLKRQQQDGDPEAAGAVAAVPNVPKPPPMEPTSSQGSTRRQALLNARRQQSSQLWIAHESGLNLTGSTAKLLTTPTSTNPRHQLLGMVYRAKRVFQFQPTRSRNNTDSSSTSLLSTRRFLPWHKAVIRRNKQQEQRAISAGGRIEHNDDLRGVADSSSSSMLLNAVAHYDSAPSTALEASSGRNSKDELIMSNMVPPPPMPRPNSLLARNASVNNYYRGEGFEIGYVDLSLSQSFSASSSSSSASTSDNAAEDELRDCFDVQRELSIGRPPLRDSEPPPTLRRPVFMKRASIFSGEGMEVADYQHTIAAESDEKAFLHNNNHTTTHHSLQRSISFDATLSYERVEAKFVQRLRRSESDGNLDLLQKTSADEAFLDDLSDFTVYDSWLAPTSHAQKDMGFAILGTSAHDTDCHPHVLSPPMMERLHRALPNTRQGENYWLRYSLVRDGASRHSFLDIAKKCSPLSILAVETVDGEVFGAFTCEAWHREAESYGHGPSFLWRYRHNRHDKTWSVLDQATLEGELDVYPLAAGSRAEVQLCTKTTFGIAGVRETFTPARTLGDGTVVGKDEWGFGLRMTGDLMLEGTSSPCYPFQSPSLSRIHADGSPFEIVNIELWTMTPCLDVVEAERLELKHLFLREHLRPL